MPSARMASSLRPGGDDKRRGDSYAGQGPGRHPALVRRAGQALQVAGGRLAYFAPPVGQRPLAQFLVVGPQRHVQSGQQGDPLVRRLLGPGLHQQLPRAVGTPRRRNWRRWATR